jgi:hypothetical protein
VPATGLARNVTRSALARLGNTTDVVRSERDRLRFDLLPGVSPALLAQADQEILRSGGRMPPAATAFEVTPVCFSSRARERARLFQAVLASSRPRTTTAAPSAASSLTIASPRPLLDPVTRGRLPTSYRSIILVPFPAWTHVRDLSTVFLRRGGMPVE